MRIMYDQYMPRQKEKNSDKLAVETVRGAKGAPWKALEDDGKRSICARNVRTLLRRKILSKEVSRKG